MRKFWRRRKYEVLTGITILGIGCALGAPGYAFGLIPTIVYDPVVQQTLTWGLGGIWGVNAATLTQTIRGVQIALSEYQRIDMMRRGGWNVTGLIMQADMTVNQVGELAGWSRAMDGTPGIMPSIWSRATIGIRPSPQIWGGEIPGSSHILANLASVEAIDGSASRCLDQVAQVRGNVAINQPMIMNLMGAQNDDSDASNGTVGQLNVANGTLEQGNEESRTQTGIQTCAVEQTALANKISRDHLASELNQQSVTMTELATMPTSWDGSTTFATPIP